MSEWEDPREYRQGIVRPGDDSQVTDYDLEEVAGTWRTLTGQIDRSFTRVAREQSVDGSVSRSEAARETESPGGVSLQSAILGEIAAFDEVFGTGIGESVEEASVDQSSLGQRLEWDDERLSRQWPEETIRNALVGIRSDFQAREDETPRNPWPGFGSTAIADSATILAFEEAWKIVESHFAPFLNDGEVSFRPDVSNVASSDLSTTPPQPPPSTPGK